MQNTKLSNLEHAGLEYLLQRVITAYETEVLGYTGFELTQAADITRWTENGLDIVDGMYDLYSLSGFYVSGVIVSDGCCALVGYKSENEDDYDNENDAPDVMVDITACLTQFHIDLDGILEQIERL